MGLIRKIALSLLLVATLAHGQLSVDLNGGDITAPLQHQGKIQQEYSPGNIYRTYGDSPGPNYLRRTGSQAKCYKSLGKIRNHNMLMAEMTSPDCLKWPETPQPRPG